MLETLFHIPSEIGGWPLAGPSSWLMMVWGVVAVVTVLWLLRRQGWSTELRYHLVTLGIAGLIIAVVLPRLLHAGEGLPIRGFGVALLAAVVAATGLAIYRARQYRVDPEVIMSMAMWLIVPGFIGARVFYVIEYWQRDFRVASPDGGMDWAATLTRVFSISQGGLVVYGSVAGAALGLFWFARRHRLPLLALADLLAPSLILGQAIGRLGCYMNGCCYGGVEHELPWRATFPPGSPPYLRQVQDGRLPVGGLFLAGDDLAEPRVSGVVPASESTRKGVSAGDRIVSLTANDDTFGTERLGDVRGLLLRGQQPETTLRIKRDGGQPVTLVVRRSELGRSLPIHPTQIYSFIDGIVILLFLLAIEPFKRRDGELLLLLLLLYSVTRILMEILRTDEPGQFGTSLTISQWISAGLLVGSILIWFRLLNRPPTKALESPIPEGQLWRISISG